MCIKGLHLILYSLRHSSNLMKYSSSQSSLHSAFIKVYVAVYVTMRSETFARNPKFVAKIRNSNYNYPVTVNLSMGPNVLSTGHFKKNCVPVKPVQI